MPNQLESSQKSAYLYAIKLLSKRDYSTHKLTTKLKSKGFQEQHTQDAIEEIIGKGFLKEDLYIESRIKSFMIKGLHPTFILLKLEEEYLESSNETIQLVFDEYRLTIAQQIESLLNKKMPKYSTYEELDDESKDKVKQKAISHALSKGHEIEVIENIFSRLITTNQ